VVAFSAVANRDRGQRSAISEKLIKNGSPSVHFMVLDGQIRSEAEVYKRSWSRLQHVSYPPQDRIEFVLIVLCGIRVENPVVVNGGVRAPRLLAVLKGPKKNRRCDRGPVTLKLSAKAALIHGETLFRQTRSDIASACACGTARYSTVIGASPRVTGTLPP
jgi:hypothetical protein